MCGHTITDNLGYDKNFEKLPLKFADTSSFRRTLKTKNLLSQFSPFLPIHQGLALINSMYYFLCSFPSISAKPDFIHEPQ